MAIYFDMAICTGKSSQNALHIKAHFADMESIIQDYPFLERCDDEGNWWITLVPKGFGFGIPWDKSELINSQAKRLAIIKSIYGRLQKISKFELAVMGWEAADFVRDLDDQVAKIGGIKISADYLSTPGTVLHKDIWEDLGEPENFTPFSSSHVWTGDLKALAKSE